MSKHRPENETARGLTVWVSCGVLRAELEALHRAGKMGGRLLFLDSGLHVTPPTLEATLRTTLEQILSDVGASTDKLVLIYGDCCAGMLDLARWFHAGRVDAINCAQMLVGRTQYRALMREQAFLLLPEWAARWREILQVRLGLSEGLAREFLHDHHRSLVYLDTGLVPMPRRALQECSDSLGLPWRVEAVALDGLLTGLLEAEARAPWRRPPEELR